MSVGEALKYQQHMDKLMRVLYFLALCTKTSTLIIMLLKNIFRNDTQLNSSYHTSQSNPYALLKPAVFDNLLPLSDHLILTYYFVISSKFMIIIHILWNYSYIAKLLVTNLAGFAANSEVFMSRSGWRRIDQDGFFHTFLFTFHGTNMLQINFLLFIQLIEIGRFNANMILFVNLELSFLCCVTNLWNNL